MPSLFDQSISGPPPGPSTVGTEAWCDLGLIPTGNKIWIGSLTASAPEKNLVFDLRTNNAGESVGSLAKTTSLYKGSVSVRSGTANFDLYKRGRLHIATVIGGGTEKWWLRVTAKSGTAAEYLYLVTYTVE